MRDLGWVFRLIEKTEKGRNLSQHGILLKST